MTECPRAAGQIPLTLRDFRKANRPEGRDLGVERTVSSRLRLNTTTKKGAQLHNCIIFFEVADRMAAFEATNP